MSHFTVLVASTDVEDVDRLLEPYDEGIEAEPYWTLEAKQPSDLWYFDSFVAEELITKDATFEDMLAAYKAKYDTDVDEEKFRITDAGLERQTTYNKESRWDWYQVGGRWSGALRLRPERDGAGHLGFKGQLAVRNHEETGIDVLCVDAARKGDLDIDGVRSEAVERANARWDKYQEVVDGLPTPKTWEQILEEHMVRSASKEDREPALNAARVEYNAQPFIAALKGAELFDYFGSWDDEFATHTRESYAKDARDRAVGGYAFLSEATGWLEPGKMGWFGSSTETPASRAEYHAKVAAVIDGLPDDVWLTVVDCHI